METRKKGISLIVLIITIIVMIILAAAIILSISNSGIMDKANKAKKDSDTANLKEYVSILEAEWELGTKETSKVEYVNGKLKDKGYTQALLMEDGTLYTNLQANAKKALQDGIQIGEEVKYNTVITKNKYTPDSTKTGSTGNAELETQTNLKWIYIGISDDGELLISPDVSKDIPSYVAITLLGKTGWLYGMGEVDTTCDRLYSVPGKGNARSMNVEDLYKLAGGSRFPK